MLSITIDNRRGVLKKDWRKKPTITKNRGLVCLLNENTGEYKVIDENILPNNLIDVDNYKPFGCYVKDKNIYVANHDKIIKLDKEGNYINYTTNEGFKNPHQILITDNVVCYTNTGNDKIHLLNNGRHYIIDLKTLNKSYKDIDGVDTHHVNSLCLHDNKVFFCLHNRGTKPSQYFYIDLKNDKIEYLFEYGMCSHNCEVEGDFLYTFDTEGGNFACINWKTGNGWETKLVDYEEYFLRGLVLTKNHFIVGTSLRKTPTGKGDSEILIVDRETKEIVNKYKIEGYNTVRDIKQI